jgi:hypothetical protein
MRRTIVFFLMFVLFQGALALGQENQVNHPKEAAKPVGLGHRSVVTAPKTQVQKPAAPARNTQVQRPAAVVRNAPARQPVVINISRPSAGRNNQAFHPVQQPVVRQPSYGKVQWQAKPQPRTQAAQQPVRAAQPTQQYRNQVNAGHVADPKFKAANAVHHHPYAQGYVRKKLQKIGVKVAPSYITDRAEIVATDRAHSIARFPKTGPDNRALSAKMVSPRHFNDNVVRQHMSLVSGDDYRHRFVTENANERQTNHYYWHQDKDFNYCHYIDGSGYHWYGWYAGDQYFWTRNYAGRWWWYDTEYSRWNFWNDGFWWWQDPYHVGDLYCYNNDTYIPANSADDQIVVTSTDQPASSSYNCPDGTRSVKIATPLQDAFLYDTANPPSFDPIYLASGVQSVQFSDMSNGKPMEIILKLGDGSFDMFDAQGNPYSPTYSGDDQAAPDATQP